jgi:hypothetical protein
MVDGAPLLENAEAFDELWLSGSASARARTELAARGFVVVERVFERLEARQAGR